MSLEVYTNKDENNLQLFDDRRRNSSVSPRRTSGASSVSGYCSEISDRDRSQSYDSQGHRLWKSTLQRCQFIHIRFHTNTYLLFLDEEETQDLGKTDYSETTKHSPTTQKPVSIRVEQSEDTQESGCFLSIPKVAASSSSETLTGSYCVRNIIIQYIYTFKCRCYCTKRSLFAK